MKLLPQEIRIMSIFAIGVCTLQNAVADALSDYRDSMAWADAAIAKKQQDEKAAKYEKDAELRPPKLGLIRDISPYEKTTEMLGFSNEKGPYLILLEDYKFKDFDGNEYTIPAGFIFDGTSLPTSHDEGLFTDRSPVGFGIQVLMPDQTKYSSLAEGMIHDYMYRHPNQFSKESADLLFRSNLRVNGNKRADTLYRGVDLGGFSSYNEHLKKTKDGTYKFTDEYYRENIDIWNRQSQIPGENPFNRIRDPQGGQVCKPGDDPFDLNPEDKGDGNGQVCPVPSGGSSGGQIPSKPTTRRRGGSGGGDTRARIW